MIRFYEKSKYGLDVVLIALYSTFVFCKSENFRGHHRYKKKSIIQRPNALSGVRVNRKQQLVKRELIEKRGGGVAKTT